MDRERASHVRFMSNLRGSRHPENTGSFLVEDRGTFAMKKLVGLSVIALAVSAHLAFAQTAPANEMDVNQIIRNLETAGYTDVHDLEKDDGIFEAEATNTAGQRVELDIDPATGAVL